MSLTNPKGDDLNHNAVLTQFAQRYTQDPNRFLFNALGPTIPSADQGGILPEVDLHDFNKPVGGERAEGASSKKSGFGHSTTAFKCVKYSEATTLTDEDRQKNQVLTNLARLKTEYVSNLQAISLDSEQASVALTPTSWTNRTNVGTRWDQGSSNPVSDVRTAKDDVEKRSFFRPNTVVIGAEVFSALMENDDIKDRLGDYGSPDAPAAATLATLEALWESRVLVSRALRTNAAGNALEYIMGKHALVMYLPENAVEGTPSAFYNIRWQNSPIGGQDINVKSFRDDDRDSTVIVATSYRTVKIVGDRLCQALPSVIS